MEYLKFATDTQRLADQARYIAYGPARQSSAELVGLYQDGMTEMAPHMPTSPEALENAVLDDPEFWADRDAETDRALQRVACLVVTCRRRRATRGGGVPSRKNGPAR